MNNNFTDLLTKEEQIRYGFYTQFADDAQKAYDFVMRPNKEASVPATPTVAIDGRLDDGVYLIDVHGNATKFIGEATEVVNDTAYIGIVMGSHSLKIALKDLPDSELTNADDETEYDGYIESYDDAVADWNGKQNTEHIKTIGTDIELAEGEWIPSVAELYLIYLNKKAINKALEFVGGQPISGGWYWSSTERDATNAWTLYLSDGSLDWYAKVTHSFHVRAVAAFL